MEFNRLEDTDAVDDDLEPVYKPIGDDLNKDGVIDIVADKVTQYGITVRNLIKVPLHVSLFYFDCSDLKIASYYLPPSTGAKAEPSLLGSGILPIGYGDGGGTPYTYYVRPGQDLDVGFLKLFISTEPVDLEGIQQPSPFDQGRGGTNEKRKPRPIWDTLTIAVVQRRPRSKAAGLAPETHAAPATTSAPQTVAKSPEKHAIDNQTPQRNPIERQPSHTTTGAPINSTSATAKAPIKQSRDLDEDLDAKSTAAGSAPAQVDAKAREIPVFVEAAVTEPQVKNSVRRFLSRLFLCGA